jgi:hypothetical protein
LKTTVAGTELKTCINGELALEYTLAEPVSGKIGPQSKTDRSSHFKDVRSTGAAGRRDRKPVAVNRILFAWLNQARIFERARCSNTASGVLIDTPNVSLPVRKTG